MVKQRSIAEEVPATFSSLDAEPCSLHGRVLHGGLLHQALSGEHGHTKRYDARSIGVFFSGIDLLQRGMDCRLACDITRPRIGIVLGILAVVFLITSLASWCPAYIPLGISTRKEGES